MQQRPGLSYELHLRLMAAALCLPLVVLALSWLVQLLYGTQSRRLNRRIQQIEDAKRKMVKELKVGAGAGGRCDQGSKCSVYAILLAVAGWLSMMHTVMHPCSVVDLLQGCGVSLQVPASLHTAVCYLTACECSVPTHKLVTLM